VSDLTAIDYLECEDLMRRAKLSLSPCEAHAIAIGIFCGSTANDNEIWEHAVYEDLEGDDQLISSCKERLDMIFLAAQNQIRDTSFSFQLWLPEEADSTSNAAVAIKEWAQGFLYGFGLAVKLKEAALTEECEEALRDFYDIGQLNTDLDGSEDENQTSLTEIEEYMRIAVMLIYEEIHSVKFLER
tara:strand:- start:264 stop:821 length:558 start_codon:yes stop_codon:yes gene_type:complete